GGDARHHPAMCTDVHEQVDNTADSVPCDRLPGEESGELLAFVCFGPIPMTERSFDLYWIATAPTHGRRGIASRLLAAMEEELNGSVVYVDTSSTAGYARARAFYEKNGYRIAARLRDFYKTGDDRVIYRKEL
ncbi:MAG: GNAT family N-acetyltransferase, partial [Desulfurivibrionaceae bacterium]